MSLLILMGVSIAILVIPLMIASRIMGAQRTTFWSCLIASIAAIAAGHSADSISTNAGLASVLTLALTAICFCVILEVKYLQSIVIALLSYAIKYGMVVLTVGVGTLAHSV